MCGICGIIFRKDAPRAEEGGRLCAAMRDSMRHRGPDDEGLFSDPSRGIFLGHRRLSIMDLSPAGRQPLWNEDHTVAVMVNGEFYNHPEKRAELLGRGHRFTSTGDSEMLAHLFEEWGEAAFEKLRGMFAAVVYDARRGALHLARDPMGIKPLYLFESGRLIAFASEIRAFHVLPDFERRADGDAIADFLLWGSIPAPRTLWRQVRALLPGERLRITDGRIERRGGPPVAGWCAEAAAAPPPDPQALREDLRDSVRRHLVSDAPIGLFLSGGIDSGMLAGTASEISPAPVHTVSVTLPSHPLDESALARETATLYGTHHHEVPLDQAAFEADLALFLDHLDQPSIDGFNTFIVSKAARQAGLKVALSGVGGDELFAGYRDFELIPRIVRLQRLAGRFGAPGRNLAARAVETLRRGPGASRVAEAIRQPCADPRAGYLACRGLFVGRFLESLLAPELRAAARRALERFMDETTWAANPRLPPHLAIGGLEVTRYMTGQLLRDTDVMSMSHSLEVRTPLVDVEVARAALPFLAHPSPGDGHPKWLLRQALNTPLPDRVVRRPKQGFVFPWEEWLRGAVLRDFDENTLETGAWISVLDADAVRAWREDYAAGRAHWSCFWAICVLRRFLGKTIQVEFPG